MAFTKRNGVTNSNSDSWSATGKFNDWFASCFVPETKRMLRELGQDEKAILFPDNCSAHPSEEELLSDDGKIIAKFFFPKRDSVDTADGSRCA